MTDISASAPNLPAQVGLPKNLVPRDYLIAPEAIDTLSKVDRRIKAFDNDYLNEVAWWIVRSFQTGNKPWGPFIQVDVTESHLFTLNPIEDLRDDRFIVGRQRRFHLTTQFVFDSYWVLPHADHRDLLLRHEIIPGAAGPMTPERMDKMTRDAEVGGRIVFRRGGDNRPLAHKGVYRFVSQPGRQLHHVMSEFENAGCSVKQFTEPTTLLEKPPA